MLWVLSPADRVELWLHARHIVGQDGAEVPWVFYDASQVLQGASVCPGFEGFTQHQAEELNKVLPHCCPMQDLF